MVAATQQRGGTSLTSAILLTLATVATPAAAASCSGYTTTGPAGNQTYANYAFYDYRQLGGQLSGTPVYADNPDFDNGQFALATSSYFNSSAWTGPWSTLAAQKPANATRSQYVDMVYTPLNVAIVTDNSTKPDGQTVMSLTTTKLETYSATSQINTNTKYMHASVRMSARMLGPPGACGAFFLYGDDNNESDIELLTNDTSEVFHATNHPSQDAKGNLVPGASSRVPIPQPGSVNGTANGSWTDWTEWRMDWLPDRTLWIVNGILVVDKTYSPPKIPSYLGISMWSNGGTWTGNMTLNQTATLQIRWIEVAYNTSSDPAIGSGSSCVVNDNNNGTNNVANSWSSPRLSSFGFAWFIIFMTSLWSFL